MSDPVLLVPRLANHEVVAVLTGLLELATKAELTGLIFGASLKGQKYYCDAAGTLHRNGVVALGVASMLQAEIEHRLRHRSIDTLM